MKRALKLSLNPTGIGSAVSAVYAGIVMILNAASHHTVINPQVIVAALSAAAFLYTRMKVTPVADPKDGSGAPLLPVPAPPVTVTRTSASGTVTLPPLGAAGEKLGPPAAN